MKSIDLRTSVAGIKLDKPFYNASGVWSTTEEELEQLCGSLTGAVLTKSSTVNSRKGNEPPKYFDFGGNSISSNGLENLGYKKYIRIIPKLKQRYGKPFFVSFTGLSINENVTMARELSKVDEIDGLELSLSCPNIQNSEQIGNYDFDGTRRALEKITSVCTKPLGVKLAAYFEDQHYEQMAAILNESGVAFITCIDGLGNGLVINFEEEKVVIRPNQGHGSIGGEAIKPFGLANVRKFRQLLLPEIAIVGVGGISSGRDIFEYILAGADAVQIGTALHREGISVFSRVEEELIGIMVRKGYTDLPQYQRKLKEF